MKNLRTFLILIPILTLMACTKLLFVKPMPKAGDIIRELPAFLTGTYKEKGGSGYMEIERLSEKHCIIQSYYGMSADSMQRRIREYKTDSTSAELRGSTLITRRGDSTITENFTEEDGYFYSEKKPQYEINVGEGYFIDDFKNMLEKKAIFKEYEGAFFLNVVEDKNWFLISMQETDKGFIIQNSSVADTSFSETSTYYNGITTIQKLSSYTYLADPTDQEFFELLEEPKLFKQEEWIREGGSAMGFLTEYQNLLIGGGIAFVILLILLAVKGRKNA